MAFRVPTRLTTRPSLRLLHQERPHSRPTHHLLHRALGRAPHTVRIRVPIRVRIRLATRLSPARVPIRRTDRLAARLSARSVRLGTLHNFLRINQAWARLKGPEREKMNKPLEIVIMTRALLRTACFLRSTLVITF